MNSRSFDSDDNLIDAYSCRELQQLIDSTANPSSPFHISHASSSTDVTVYPPPSSALSEEPESKKRRLNEGSANGASATGHNSANSVQQARFANLVLANKHIDKVHAEVKKECEQLAELCVSIDICTCDALHVMHDMQDRVKLWVNLSMPK